MKIYIMGDIHGSYKPIRELHMRLNCQINFYKEENILVLLGDSGCNYFFNYRDKNFKEKISKYNFTYFIIRGNHEQRPSICMNQFPQDWHIEQFFDNNVYVENNYPKIKYALDDISFYNINEYKTLIIPGAYSVDKWYRLQKGMTWFEQEQLSEEEKQNGINLLKQNNWTTDLVLSHTCPIIFEPTDLFLSTIDQSAVDKSMERYLGNIEYNLNYKVWCWGHYHIWREYPRNAEIPSYENPRQLMLFNDVAVELQDLMNNANILNKK